MEKIVKILLPFIIASSALFSGCKKKDNRVALSFGDIHATETREISIAELAEITNAKENFLFVVNSTNCTCWQSFEPTLNEYLTKNKALCYRISFGVFKDAASTFGLANVSEGTTTFAIFEDGAVKTFLNSSKDSNIMYNSKKFTKYMDETIILQSCYFITKDDVNAIKASGQNAVIYFERSGCGDCSALNPGLLRDYVKNHSGMNKLYTIDCQQYYRKSDMEDYQSYLDFKDEMGLSTANNPTYGYGAGVFPYFAYIENGQYASGSVIYNDSVTKQDDKYVVSDSYYTAERVQSLQYTNKVIKGLELTADDVLVFGEFGMWKNESADKHYKEILNSFLDYALPKQTYNF